MGTRCELPARNREIEEERHSMYDLWLKEQFSGEIGRAENEKWSWKGTGKGKESLGMMYGEIS